MKRTVIGFLVSLVLVLGLLAAVWGTFPTSATPARLSGATFAQMTEATKDMEAYLFVSALDEGSQVSSWRLWINDKSAESRIFMIGATRMQNKLLMVSAAAIGGIFLAFLVRFIAKKVFAKERARVYHGILARLALILAGTFVLALILPVVVANHPMALIFSIPLVIGFAIATTGKDPAAPPSTTVPVPPATGPLGQPPGFGRQGIDLGAQQQGGYPPRGGDR